MKTLAMNGINLAYTRGGNGVPLLLVHGFPLDSTSWNEVRPFLEDDFDVITPDLRGFGQSTTLETEYTVTDMADDLAGLLDHLGIKKVAIAGHSMGGYITLAFAKKYPERINAIGLISSQAASDSAERKEGRLKSAQEVAINGVSSMAQTMPEKLSANPRVQSLARDLISRQKNAGVVGALKAMAAREDYLSFLKGCHFPIVLIHGDADTLIPIDRSKEILAAADHARLLEIKGANHMPMMEFPEQTAKGIKLLK